MLLGDGTLTLCSLYLPPVLPNADLLTELESLHSQLSSPFVVLTDANAHHVSWGSTDSNARGSLIADWLENTNLNLLNSGEPTYISSGGQFSHIDLSICSNNMSSAFSWEPYCDNLQQ